MAKFITLRVENIIFRGIGITRLFIEASVNITFKDCYFKNTVTSREIIRIESHPSKYYTGFLHFRQCHFINNVALESFWNCFCRPSSERIS